MKKWFLILFSLLLVLSFATVVVVTGCDDDDDDDDDTADDDFLDDDIGDDDVVDDDVVDDDVVDDDVVDDDVVDDDVVDDDVVDDDVVDDDTGTGEEDFIFDDGTDENGLTATVGDCIVATTFTPSGYPATLTEVSVFISDNTGWNNDFQIVILADENGNGPEDTEIVYESATLQATTGDDFFVHDLTAKAFTTELTAGNWIVGVRNLAGYGPYVGVDESVNAPTGYFYDIGSTTWYSFTEIMLPGIAMIRGHGTY